MIRSFAPGLAAAVLLAAPAARAEAPVSLSGQVGAASDYVFRGGSETRGDPQVFAGVEAGLGAMAYAGVWASNVDFGDGTDFEFDLYAGVRPTVGAVSLDFGVMYYGYAGQPSGAGWDMWEAKAAASIPFGPATLGAAAYYSPDYSGGLGQAWYGEISGSVSIPRTRATVSGAIGRQTIDRFADYTTWNLGVGLALTDRVGVDLRYSDTDASGLGSIYDARVVGSLSVAF